MLTYLQKLQYKDALENVSKLNSNYKTARAMLYFINRYGFPGEPIHDGATKYECVDEKASPFVRENLKKSNYIFAILERYVKIDKKYKTKFGHKFFDCWNIESFNVPKDVCDKLIQEYLELVETDKQYRLNVKREVKEDINEDCFTIK